MTLLEYFAKIPDFRRDQGKRFGLAQLLTIITLGVMSGYYGYRELRTFMKANELELKEILNLTWAKMPSHVTIRTIMQEVEAKEMITQFNAWCVGNQEPLAKAGIALDGKCLGSTVKQVHQTEQDFVQVVSAFVHQRQQVLGVTSFQSSKQGEGQAVRDLLKKLQLKDAIFTLDALHCQKKTLTLINQQGNHYVVQLKNNCAKLMAQAQSIISQQAPLDCYHSREKQKGRLEERMVRVFACPVTLPQWRSAQIKTLIVVDRRTQRQEDITHKTHFYLSSLTDHSAQVFAKLIRGHWSIENNLHWVKDVIQNEDQATLRQANAAQNLSIFKNIALNTFRQHGYSSLKHAIISFSNKIPQLFNLIHPLRT